MWKFGSVNAAGRGDAAREWYWYCSCGLGVTARESGLEGAGDAARDIGLDGAGDIARMWDRWLDCLDGSIGDDALSRSVDSRSLYEVVLPSDDLSFELLFMAENGLWLFFKLPLGVLNALPPLRRDSRPAASGFGLPAAAYAVKGFLKTVFFFSITAGWGLAALDMLPPPLVLAGMGEVGRKSSLSTSTKFDGKRPTIRRSRFNLPIHHEPSPALRHSIRSPSMKPRSRFVSPPHEYVALHQHGKRVGSWGAVSAICGVLSRHNGCARVDLSQKDSFRKSQFGRGTFQWSYLGVLLVLTVV